MGFALSMAKDNDGNLKMVNATTSSAEWRPRFAPPASKPEVPVEAFSLQPEQPTKRDAGFEAFGEDGFTVLDAIDIVNPLQQLPLIGTIYRELTGDTLDPFSRMAGSTLYFGPIGAAASAANVVMEAFTGKDVGAHMMAFITESEPNTKDVEIASLDSGANAAAGTSSIIPTVAGTDGLDPVTTWALNEMQFRKVEAEKRGLTVPERSYTTLVENAVPAPTTVVDTVRPPAIWSKPVERSTAVVVPIPSPEIAPADQKVPNKPEQQALNAFQAEHRASPETLLRLKQTKTAYQTVNFEAALHPPPQRDQDLAKKKGAEPIVPQPQMPTPANEARPVPTRDVKHTNNWFSASMVEALGKYKSANGADKDALNQLTSQSSLH